MQNANVMSANMAKPAKVAIIGASGTYGQGILARAEQVGVEAVVITRSPHKHQRDGFQGCPGHQGMVPERGRDHRSGP